MSLLLKSGDQFFEISDADLAKAEIPEREFEKREGDAQVADRSLVVDVAVPVFAQVQIGSGCDKPTYGASCGKAPNCP
jgi:hypothetical protein